MKIIKDIRLYKSEEQNEYGFPITQEFSHKKLNAIVHRIVMKLREQGFSLGEFDHLYINFTTCEMDKRMTLSNKVDQYHPWYRYCLVNVSADEYGQLDFPESLDFVLEAITSVLVDFFVTEAFNETRISSCINQAIEQGEDMLMKYKKKVTTKRKVIIFLRYLDDCIYYPLLRVYDMADKLLFEKNLPKTSVLDTLGEIQVSTKKVTIKSRKNAFGASKKEMTFEY